MGAILRGQSSPGSGNNNNNSIIIVSVYLGLAMCSAQTNYFPPTAPMRSVPQLLPLKDGEVEPRKTDLCKDTQ